MDALLGASGLQALKTTPDKLPLRYGRTFLFTIGKYMFPWQHLVLFPLFYLVLPIYFIIRLWTDQSHDLGKWISQIVLYGSYIAYLFCVGFWPMSGGYFLRYILLVGFVIVAFKSYFNASRTLGDFGRFKSLAYHFLMLALTGFFTFHLYLAFKGASPPNEAIPLKFPLQDGTYYIVQGGASPVINHHFGVAAQRFAVDIVQMNALGLRASKIIPQIVEDYPIFGTEVHSPCNGMIMEAIDGNEDRKLKPADSENPAGNYLVIAIEDTNLFLILAHLKKESLCVQKGDCVQTGQVLAQVGNSGNTTEPHLHMHVMERGSGDVLFTGKGVPMSFKGRFLVRNDRYVSGQL